MYVALDVRFVVLGLEMVIYALAPVARSLPILQSGGFALYSSSCELLSALRRVVLMQLLVENNITTPVHFVKQSLSKFSEKVF